MQFIQQRQCQTNSIFCEVEVKSKSQDPVILREPGHPETILGTEDKFGCSSKDSCEMESVVVLHLLFS